jgi:hypothetical protein
MRKLHRLWLRWRCRSGLTRYRIYITTLLCYSCNSTLRWSTSTSFLCRGLFWGHFFARLIDDKKQLIAPLYLLPRAPPYLLLRPPFIQTSVGNYYRLCTLLFRLCLISLFGGTWNTDSQQLILLSHNHLILVPMDHNNFTVVPNNLAVTAILNLPSTVSQCRHQTSSERWKLRSTL